jgi:hypothetical protein
MPRWYYVLMHREVQLTAEEQTTPRAWFTATAERRLR